MNRVKVGVIGCGNISEVYLKSCRDFDILDMVACADVIPERAKAAAERWGVPRACAVKDLLRDPEIEIVLNLTVPAAHAAIALEALRHGKHVHGEKPLAVRLEDGEAVLTLAREKGLRVGCAPDTFFGAGLQTCRQVIDGGRIGEPVAASVTMLYHGPESFHPDPAFFYQPGGGPLFDMAPYYLTALIHLIGPIRRVTGSARVTYPERIVTSDARRGERIRVNTPTHIVGVLEFHNGAIATLTTSFDVWEPYNPQMVIHGTLGTLHVPDANFFGGTARVRIGNDGPWEEAPPVNGYADNHRGIGLADMACALRSGRPHRACGEVGFHVLEVMHAILDSASSGRHVDIHSSATRPAPLSVGLAFGTLDD